MYGLHAIVCVSYLITKIELLPYTGNVVSSFGSVPDAHGLLKREM